MNIDTTNVLLMVIAFLLAWLGKSLREIANSTRQTASRLYEVNSRLESGFGQRP